RDSWSRAEGTTTCSRSRHWRTGAATPTGSLRMARSTTLSRLRAGRSGFATGTTSHEGSGIITTILPRQRALALRSARHRPGPYRSAQQRSFLGIFWTGRESTHGLTAFWEHWWCPIPLALTVLGLVTAITTRRSSPAG